jgi:hypothetical protein
VNEIEVAVAGRALELAREFDQRGEDLRGLAGDFGEWQSLRDFLVNVTRAISGASEEDEMVRHFAFSLVVSAFDPRGESGLTSN